MQVHELKTAPPYFQDLMDGIKPFEVRFNDRDYQVGDVLRLREYSEGAYTGRVMMRQITYMTDDPQYCKEGYVILSWAVREEPYTGSMIKCKRCGRYYPPKYIANEGTEICVNCMLTQFRKHL